MLKVKILRIYASFFVQTHPYGLNKQDNAAYPYRFFCKQDRRKSTGDSAEHKRKSKHKENEKCPERTGISCRQKSVQLLAYVSYISRADSGIVGDPHAAPEQAQLKPHDK